MSSSVLSQLQAARIAAQKGQHSKASRYYNKAVKQDRRNPALYLEAGVNAAEGGDLNLARKYLQHALELDGTNPDIPFNLGHVELNSHLYSAARKSFERVIELDGSYPEAYYSLAEALYGLGRQQDALPHAQRAAQEAPRDIDGLMLLARCQYDLGQFDTAGHTLSDLLSLLPTHPDAHLLLASIYGKQSMSRQVGNILPS